MRRYPSYFFHHIRSYRLQINHTLIDSSLPDLTIVDIECRVVRDYGMMTGITNERQWAKREIHIMDGNNQCRLTLWNNQVRRLIVQTLILLH
jgi:hypothetical protein